MAFLKRKKSVLHFKQLPLILFLFKRGGGSATFDNLFTHLELLITLIFHNIIEKELKENAC